jgi:hypothetical protein
LLREKGQSHEIPDSSKNSPIADLNFMPLLLFLLLNQDHKIYYLWDILEKLFFFKGYCLIFLLTAKADVSPSLNGQAGDKQET